MKKEIIKNKNIYNYKIKKKFIAGIILHGWEVKSIKKKNINIQNCNIQIDKNKEIYLTGIHIDPINNKKLYINKTNRKIKILLKKKEIEYIYIKNKIKKYTLILISIIKKKQLCKIIIGLSKYKKKYNKKKYIQEKEWKKKNKFFNID